MDAGCILGKLQCYFTNVYRATYKDVFLMFLERYVTFLSIFLKGGARPMKICSCYSKSGEAGIRMIQELRFYWIPPYLLLLALYETIVTSPLRTNVHIVPHKYTYKM